MTNRSETFGRLLKAGISSIVNCEGKKAPIIEDELGQLIGVSGDSIQRYKAGHLPPEPRTVQILAEAAIRRGFLGRAWLQRFLHAARYPFADKLLDQLCPIGPVRPRPPRVYENLPAPTYSQFVMREQAFAEVVDGLQQRSAVVLIVGLGGNGKTSLAREVAACCLRDNGDVPWFDAVVWVSDKDRQGTTNLSIVLDEIARTLDYPGFTQFEHEEKRREVEQLLRRQRVLVVVDNFETVTDGALLAWLLRLPEPSKALITSREYGREYRRGSWPVELRGMTEAEARELISERVRVLKIEKLVGDLTQLEPLLAATGGNPKALEITLGLIKYERRQLQQVVDDLYAARGDLFDDLFTRAWVLLDEAARRVLLVLTFFPTSASGEVLSATADVQGFAFDRAVERLIDLALVDVQQADLTSAPRYTLHPLVRAFARAKLQENNIFENAARNRWVVFFCHYTHRAEKDVWDSPYRYDRLELEIVNIQAAAQFCYETNQSSNLMDIIFNLESFWSVRGYYKIRDAIIELGLQVVEQLKDPSQKIQLLCMKVRSPRDYNMEVANQCIMQAKQLLQEMKNPDPNLIMKINSAYVRICVQKGNFDEAVEYTKKNINIIEQMKMPPREMWFYSLVDYLRLQGRHNEAEDLFLRLLSSSEDSGGTPPISGWVNGARVALDMGWLDLTQERLQQADGIARLIGHRGYLVTILQLNASLQERLGNINGARIALADAIDLFERLGRHRELAKARAALAQLDERAVTTS
jgi:tetratricopeptide (TPR) repeat protein